jgi:hypothetical protein
MKGILVHIEELVGLPEPIPRTVVLPIHVYGTAIRFNCRVRILHLDIFVAHECPSGEVCSIKLRSTPKVSNGLFVLGSQGVVVPYPFPQVAYLFRKGGRGKRTDETAHLWTIFVEGKKVMCESGKCQTVLRNIQYVGVDVNVVNSARVNLQNLFKLLLCGGKILGWTFHW